MKAGDLVEYEGSRWTVLRLNKTARLAVLYSEAGVKREVPDTLEVEDPSALHVVAHPATQWNVLVAPVRPGSGPISSLLLLGTHNRIRDLILTPWRDWVPSDPARAGGPLFLHPGLPLRRGDTLIAGFQNGSKLRLSITPGFGTLASKQAAKEPPPPPAPRTRFDRNLFDDEDT